LVVLRVVEVRVAVVGGSERVCGRGSSVYQ